MPKVFKSSKIIVWFSLIILLENLCMKTETHFFYQYSANRYQRVKPTTFIKFVLAYSMPTYLI